MKRNNVIILVGMFFISNSLYSQDLESGGTNSWLFHTPDDGRTTMYVAPKINGNWSWGDATRFHNTGDIDITGNIYINSGIDDNHIYWRQHNMTMGTKPGDYAHNIFKLKPGGASEGFLYSAFQMYSVNSDLSQNLKVQIHTSGNSYFNGGNVGIGTDLSNNPNNYKLAVNGTIGAREVKVEIETWSDFVFNDDYKLRPIKEVENYINDYNHLPDIPTAKEVEDNGVNLGEMDAKLLQKIEELTLYVIDLQKQVNDLKSQLKEQ